MGNPESYHDKEPETAVKAHSKAGREDCCGPLLAALHTTVLLRSGAHGCLANTDGRVLGAWSPYSSATGRLCVTAQYTSSRGRWPSHCVRASGNPHDGRTADEKPGNVPPYADDGHRYPLSSFSHDGDAMVRKPGVTMPDFSALPHRATLSLVLSRNEPLMPSHPIQRQAHSACASCSL